MPVVLDDEGEARWLAGELGELVAAFPARLMAVERRDPKAKGLPEEGFTRGGDAVAGRK